MLVSETVEIERKAPPIFLSATDTAAALAGDAAEVDELIKAGEIDAVTINGRIRVHYESLVAFGRRKIAEAKR